MDTNVLVAGLRSNRGASFELLRRLGSECFVPVVSVPLVLEYEEVLTRCFEELNLASDEVSVVLDYLCSVAEHHSIYYLWRPVLKDPSDEMVLDLAVSANCNAIVTFNSRDFAPAVQWDIEVLSPGRFLRRLEEKKA